MNSRHAHRAAKGGKNLYATSEDFCKLFKEDAQSLYLLSFLLTADHEKAERCFVKGLDACIEGNSVFQEGANSWARRIIVSNAFRIISPDPSPPSPGRRVSHSAGDLNSQRLPLPDAPFAGVLSLPDFDRFVYVLSLLEAYADQNCAVLLGVSHREVRETRRRAVQQVALSEKRAAARDVHVHDELPCDGAKQPEACGGLVDNNLDF